jgi:rare lipoprotein A
MSVGDFFLLCARTVELACRNGAMTAVSTPTLAVCVICAAVNAGHAATIKPAKGPLVPATAGFVTVSLTTVDRPAAISFATRFDCPPTSFIMDVLESPAYQAPLPPLVTASLHRHQPIVPAAAAITGIASMYNPDDPNDEDAGNLETASGERYDPTGWTAAIRTDLRAQFGGVRFGRNYRPAYALVESDDKRLIVRINDVGPLKRGRIIDLNQRAMHYFDPTLQRGLIGKVRVTPLSGQDLALGPVEPVQPTMFASRFVF